MLNKEYYNDNILDFAFRGQSIAVVNGEPVPCMRVACQSCEFYGAPRGCRVARTEWANTEYTEKIDWTHVECDTPVLVRNGPNDYWHRRYFSHIEEDRIYVYTNGATSWSSISTEWWKYAKLSPITNKKGTN